MSCFSTCLSDVYVCQYVSQVNSWSTWKTRFCRVTFLLTSSLLLTLPHSISHILFGIKVSTESTSFSSFPISVSTLVALRSPQQNAYFSTLRFSKSHRNSVALLGYGLVAVYISRKCILPIVGLARLSFRVESVPNLRIRPRVNIRCCMHVASTLLICNAKAVFRIAFSAVAISGDALSRCCIRTFI